jgi:hydrogenase expression/formation protein HypC
MCLAVPAQITEIYGGRAKVSLSGNVLEADLALLENPQVGEWVLIHAGFALERLDLEEAEETLKLFAEMREGLGGPGEG